MITTTNTTARTGIVIDLGELQALIREYMAQLAPRDRLESQLRFSHFMIWLRRREERTNGTKPTN
jgi:hypothetical protein